MQGSGPVTLREYELWRTRFGSDPAVVGRSIKLSGTQRLGIGVASQGFRFPPNAATTRFLLATRAWATPKPRSSSFRPPWAPCC
jgi:hypothetical protein